MASEATTARRLVPLADLEPSIRGEIEGADPLTGASRARWAVLDGDRLDLDASIAKLEGRIADLAARMEKMNRRYREEMRYGDYNDPGFHERRLHEALLYLERILADLRATPASPA